MYESYVVHGILDLGWVFERYYAESTCGCANSLSFRRTLTSSGFWKPCCPLSIISHLTISGVIWMYVRVQYMHLASENWFLYHCQNKLYHRRVLSQHQETSHLCHQPRPYVHVCTAVQHMCSSTSPSAKASPWPCPLLPLSSVIFSAETSEDRLIFSKDTNIPVLFIGPYFWKKVE